MAHAKSRTVPALVAAGPGCHYVLITSRRHRRCPGPPQVGVRPGRADEVRGDAVTILGGIRHGETQGGPIAIQVANTEWPKWETVMAADPVPQSEIEGQARNAALTRPRPGHADLAGMQKYDFTESQADIGARQRPGNRRQGGARPGSVRILAAGAWCQPAEPRC